MIVVDVNTLAYLWIPGEMTELAEKALLASNESLRAELAGLSGLVQALYQSHLGESSATGS